MLMLVSVCCWTSQETDFEFDNSEKAVLCDLHILLCYVLCCFPDMSDAFYSAFPYTITLNCSKNWCHRKWHCISCWGKWISG